MSDLPGRSTPCVLVVEDNAISQEFLRDLFTSEGYQVRLAHDGEEALAMVKEDPPDCMVCDLVLPKMDGYEVCRRVKANPSTSLLPIIVVSGLSDLQNKLDALEAGADDFLTKPINQLEVVARVRSLVRMRQLILELESAQNVIFALATAIEQKDDYTEGHGERVAIYASSLAEHAGLSADQVRQVYMGGILHDVGKIGCPDSILHKPGPLTPDEFEIIKRHPVSGWEICRHLQSLGECTLCCIRNHHERIDGTGYPDGLGGEQIPLYVRIMSIADVFDALATARAYKPAFPTPTCFKILREEAARGWWDKDLVEAFIDMMGQRELDQAANRTKLELLPSLQAPEIGA